MEILYAVFRGKESIGGLLSLYVIINNCVVSVCRCSFLSLSHLGYSLDGIFVNPRPVVCFGSVLKIGRSLPF